jgi:hypothetical protein
MSNQVIEVQVQGDFIARLTSARPVQALVELVWNDSDATKVMVDVEQGTLGLEAITVTDERRHSLRRRPGPFLQSRRLLEALISPVKVEEFLHGEEGKGRFRALALGRVVDWIVTTRWMFAALHDLHSP